MDEDGGRENRKENNDFNGRQTWNTRYDFLFVTVGSAVGIGNVWRFPYLCYKNGGGVFLIPYFVCLMIIGLPHIILQTSLGQYTKRAPTKAWSIVPAMIGLGCNNVVMSLSSNVTYATVLAWALRYMYASLSSILPWAKCGNAWNTDNCLPFDFNRSEIHNFTVRNKTTSSVVEFWENEVLNISTGIDDVGSVNLTMLVCLILTWVISYLCVFKGANWTSKVTYVTSTLPVLMLIIILIRGVTLDGAKDGIHYFLYPDITKLYKPQVWKDAALQNIYSLSILSGSMVAFGSYNTFHHNFYRDCMVLAGMNSLASVISGFAVFSVLGFMAKQQGTSIDVVAESGPGLVFLAYPQALSMMPGSNFWSFMFFLMIFLLGLDSMFVSIEAIVAAISDVYPATFYRKNRKAILTLVISGVLFVAGIFTITQNGIYVVYIFDNFSSTGWGIMAAVVLECVSVSWMYGIEKYYDHMCSMLRYRPIFPWFKFCWKYITPVVCIALFCYFFYLYEPLTYNRTYIFPTWSIVFGWCLSLFGFLWIPGYALYYFVQNNNTCRTGHLKKTSDFQIHVFESEMESMNPNDTKM